MAEVYCEIGCVYYTQAMQSKNIPLTSRIKTVEASKALNKSWILVESCGFPALKSKIQQKLQYLHLHMDYPGQHEDNRAGDLYPQARNWSFETQRVCAPVPLPIGQTDQLSKSSAIQEIAGM